MTFGVKWVIPALLLLGAIACSVALGVEDANPPIVAVQGDSMRPALSNGDLVIVRGVTPSSLRVGDVVAVAVPTAIQARDGLPPHIEHKIVAIERTGPRIGFITKGDANPGPDPFVVRPSEIVGEVVGSVPLLGYVFLFFGSVPGDVALALVFMAAAVYFVARRRERRRACLQQLASTIVALREDADEIRSALFTSPPAPRAA
ncbi:MAG TPA: signal peptidase I, partial [Acidimicrobiales bacterium]|nr:signal peptidase I [Acidimicrobiales bacterium]